MLSKHRPPIVKRSLISWILKGNPKPKLLLLAAAIVTVLIRVIPLEMQKRIVDQAISLKAFDLLLIYCGIYLDNKSQARIQRLLDNRLKGKTTLIAVVHRLDIIKNYDKIGVLKSGKIEEMGTYSELMDKGGVLYNLVLGKE